MAGVHLWIGGHSVTPLSAPLPFCRRQKSPSEISRRTILEVHGWQPRRASEPLTAAYGARIFNPRAYRSALTSRALTGHCTGFVRLAPSELHRSQERRLPGAKGGHMGGRAPLKAGAPRLMSTHGGQSGRAYRRAWAAIIRETGPLDARPLLKLQAGRVAVLWASFEAATRDCQRQSKYPHRR